MGLETGTYIYELTSTNPTSSDPKSQGDDHLRLLKTVLKTQFPSEGVFKDWAAGNNTTPVYDYSYKSRGTVGTPLTVVTADYLKKELIYGHDGTQYILSGGIYWKASGTIATDRVPCAWELWLHPDSTSAAAKVVDVDNAGKMTLAGALAVTGALTYGGVTLNATITGTGNLVASAGPTLSGTIAVGTGNIQFGDISNRIVRGEFLLTDFGYRTSYAINELRTSWPSYTGVTNDSDERLKVQLGDLLDYWNAAKEAALLISDFEKYSDETKTEGLQGGFGVTSAQKMFLVFGGLGVHQPNEKYPYWSANCEPFGLLGLKIAGMAATEIDLIKDRLAAAGIA